MSTKKIEGRANRNTLYPGQTYSFSDLGGGRGEPAKLVLTEEPVYTQSEVRQFALDMMSASIDGPYLPNTEAMEACAKKFLTTL